MPALPDSRNGRKDPKTRHQIGTREARLRGARKDRYYVLVGRTGSHGVDEYEELGFVVERHAAKPEDGPRVIGLKQGKQGEPVEYRGHVLMSVSLDEWRARRAEEQAEFDTIEKQIVTQRHGIDSLRGLGTVRRGELALEAPGQDFTA